MSTAAEKANLARIRDNQRRSRARRKEYLHELESRLRQCELLGVEASSEIQMVARQVAEENKKLRKLLVQHGVGGESIEHHLRTANSGELATNDQSGASAAVQELEHLLQTRKTCCVDSSSLAVARDGSPESSSSMGTIQSSWDPNSINILAPRRKRTHMIGEQPSSSYQCITPSASNASQSRSNRPDRTSTHDLQSYQQHHHQQLTPIQTSRHHTPQSISSSHHQQKFESVDSQIPLANHSSYQPEHHTLAQHSYLSDQDNVNSPTTSSGANNCSYATDMISTMAGADPGEVRQELGCHPGVDYCEVDNQLVFQVLDRYTGSVGLQN